jgi:hypothetical protein
MARVAVIGSCITRDLWPIRGGLPELLYVSRASLPSLLASPVRGFAPAPEPPGGLKRHQHLAVLADLQKTALAALVAFRPTHLIFDFIDERFDLLCAGGTLVTHSWELEASGYLGRLELTPGRSIPRLSAACERLWREAAVEFAAAMRATCLREAIPILHSARWAEQSRGADGALRAMPTPEILPGRSTSLADHNRLLAAYEAELTVQIPHVAPVRAPDLRLADDAHQWGLSPFHYVPEYYEEIGRQLEALGVPRRFSGGDASPSARAA